MTTTSLEAWKVMALDLEGLKGGDNGLEGPEKGSDKLGEPDDAARSWRASKGKATTLWVPMKVATNSDSLSGPVAVLEASKALAPHWSCSYLSLGNHKHSLEEYSFKT